MVDDGVESHLYRLRLPLVFPSQFDHVADQGRHLLELGVHVGQQVGPVGLRQVPDAQQHLDVGAQAGERSSQFVAGVGDQLSLLLARRCEGRQHGVERPGQSGQLVIALDVDPGVEVLGGGHVLGRGGQPLDRTGGRPPHQVPQSDGQRQCPPRVVIHRISRRSLRVCWMSVSGRMTWTATAM